VRNNKIKTFVTSDTHFHHSNMITWKNMPRRFCFNSQPKLKKIDSTFNKEILIEDTKRMNETIIKNWNSVVGKNDLIYHLGDVSFGSANKAREIIEQLNGNIHLITGNHDNWKTIQKIKDLFVDINNYKEINYLFENKKYLICMMHYPIQRWNKMLYNSIMLCGHSHNLLKHEIKIGHIKYDIGIDTDLSNFYPILIDNIILNTRKIITNF
jgi:calcineurin-like phosphoesterase family protein